MVKYGSTLWKRLGFSSRQLVYSLEDGIALQGNTTPYDVRSLWATNNNPDTNLFLRADGSVIRQSDMVATIENHPGIFIQCDLAIDNCYETHSRNGRHLAEKSKILEWIPNASARNSYIHHTRETPTWHRLHQAEVADVEISIHDIDGKRLHFNQIPHFTMCLVFECEIEQDIQVQETKKLIASDAYRYNHPTQVLPNSFTTR